MVGSLGVTVAGSVVLVLLAVGVGLTGRFLIRRGDDRGRRELAWELAANAGPPGLAAVSLVVVVGLAGPGAWLLSSVGVASAVAAGLFDAALAAVLAETAVRLVESLLRPAVRDTRGPEYEFPDQLRTRLRTARVVGVFAVGVAAALTPANVMELTVWAAVVVGCLWYALLPVRAEHNGAFVRLPTDDERSRVAASCERVGVSPDRIVVYTGERQTLGGLIVDHGGQTTVRVQASLLWADDDALAAGLGQAEGKRRHGYERFGVVVLSSWVALTAAGFAAMFGYPIRLPLVGGTLFEGWMVVGLLAMGAFLAGGLQARRIVYRADAAASERLGAETVRDAYREFGGRIARMDQNLDGLRRAAVSRIGIEPLMVDRIARLDAPPRDGDPAFLRERERGEPPSGGGQPGETQHRRSEGSQQPGAGGRAPRGGRSGNPHAPPNSGAGGPAPERSGRSRRNTNRHPRGENGDSPQQAAIEPSRRGGSRGRRQPARQESQRDSGSKW